MIGRRTITLGLAQFAASATFAQLAMIPQPRPRVVFLGWGFDGPYGLDLIVELHRLGWKRGETIDLEWLWPSAGWGRVVGPRPDRSTVVVVNVMGLALEAMKAIPHIPIVVGASSDPVAAGIAESLSRPGRNATGTYSQSDTLMALRLSMLRDCMRNLGSIAVLYDQRMALAIRERTIQLAEKFANEAQIYTWLCPVARDDDLDAALAPLQNLSRVGLYVVGSVRLSSFGLMQSIARTAAEKGWPSIGEISSFANAGGLLGLNADFRGSASTMADQVDRILRGARPGDVPFIQNTGTHLAVNLRTAQRLGIDLPAHVLARADEVIE